MPVAFRKFLINFHFLCFTNIVYGVAGRNTFIIGRHKTLRDAGTPYFRHAYFLQQMSAGPSFDTIYR